MYGLLKWMMTASLFRSVPNEYVVHMIRHGLWNRNGNEAWLTCSEARRALVNCP